MTDLYLETRDMTVDGRNVIGRVVPYNETSYRVPGPTGERIRRGAFTRSIDERGDKVFLQREHNKNAACEHPGERVGKAVRWGDGDDGLVGEFHIRQSDLGDQTLEEIADGWWPYLSVAFRSMRHTRGADGAIEVLEAALAHVALVGAGAYEGAQVLAVRHDPRTVLAGWPERPEIDLSPVPRFW